MKGLALGLATVLAALILSSAAHAAGGSLAFVGVTGSSVELYTVPATGGVATQLVNGNGGIVSGFGGVSWSPNGSQLAYSMGGRLYVIPAAGGAAKSVPVPGISVNSLSWGPNGKQIAVADNGLFLVGVNGGKPKQVVAGTKVASNAVSNPQWAPSGGRLYYLYTQIPAISTVLTGPPPVTVRTVSASGRSNRAVAVTLPSGWSLSGFWLDVSFDGSMLALNVIQRTPAPAGSPLPYVTTQGTALVSSSGGTATVLPGFTEASWSPDGSQLCATQSGTLSLITPTGTVVSTPDPGVPIGSACRWQPLG